MIKIVFRKKAFLYLLMPNTQRKVVLEFPDLKSLIDYTLLIDISNCEIIRTKFILRCELTEADIELALNGYRATIIE